MDRVIEIFKIERKIIDGAIKNKNIIIFFSVIIIGMIVRICGLGCLSGDMSSFLIPWYKTYLSGGGLSALKDSVGDYNWAYRTIIALISEFKVSVDLYAALIKMISVFFDFLLSISTAYYLTKITKKGNSFFIIVFSVVLLLPTVVLNSAYWGQCDSVFTTFIIICLGEMYFEHYKTSFVFLGLAFAFKLQTILIIPFILCYYVYKKKFSILNFGITIFVFWLSGIVAYIMGANLFSAFTIYFNQTGTYEKMWLGFPSFWALVGDRYDYLKNYAVFFTVAVCGIILFLILLKKIRLKTSIDFFAVATLTVWTCLIFLPAMHERYSFPLDILLIILSFLDKKYIKFAVVEIIYSLLTGAAFLFANGFSISPVNSAIYLGLYCYYFYTVLDFKTAENKAETVIGE